LKIATLDEINPRIAALRAKRTEKCAAIAPLIKKCEEIRARLRSGGLPDPGTEKENRVRAILGEELLPAKPSDDEGLRQTQAEIEIIKSVVSVLDAEIVREEQAASNKVTEAVKPEIVRRGQKFAKAFLDLHQAHVDFESYVSEAEDAGGNISALRLTPAGLNTPRDPNSPYAYGFRELIDAGFAKKSDLPKELR
jgi:hypothetical protein